MSFLRPVLLVFLIASFAAAGCGKRESAVERGIREQVLERGAHADVSDLDPHTAVTITEIDVATALFEGLVAEHPQTLQPVPGVAERWEVSPDGLNYTFHLRANARWSDGSAVTADDFVQAWRRVLTPALAAPNATLLYVVQGAEAYHKGATTEFGEVAVKATSPQTLRVALEHAAPHFLSLLAHPVTYPVPLAAIRKHGGEADRSNRWTRPGSLVGNGPFVLKAWRPNQEIFVAKSPTYWDAATVRLNGIRFHPSDSIEAEERAFRAGQLHLTYVLPFGKAEAYRRDAPHLLRMDPYLDTYFLALNTARPPLDQEPVRRALALAVDRNALVNQVLRGGQTPATALTPTGLPGYTPPSGDGYDPDAARRLLSAAGFPRGERLPAIEILFNTSENLRLIAEAVQEMWRRELGLTVRLVNQERKVVLSERRAGNFQVLVSDWVGDYLDPSTFLEPWRSDATNNYTRWSHAEYDTLLFTAARNPDPATRAEQLAKAEALLLQAAPLIPLYYNTHTFLLHPSVKGWHPTLLDHHPYKHVWLEP